MLSKSKVGFLGCGNLAQAIIKGLIESKSVAAERIWASNRSEGKLKKVQETFGIHACRTNEELVETCDVVFLAVKPLDLKEVLEPIRSAFDERHLVISLAAGFPLASLEKLLPETPMLVRVMPNTPISIRRAVIGYALADESSVAEQMVRDLLAPLGLMIRCDDGGELQALTVSCGSGTGFVLELMQYWQEWLDEHGFDPDASRRMTVETFLGAAMMAEAAATTPIQDLQDRVVSKKGVTAAGLQSMRELEIERALRYSFEKAVIREQELADRS